MLKYWKDNPTLNATLNFFILNSFLTAFLHVKHIPAFYIITLKNLRRVAALASFIPWLNSSSSVGNKHFFPLWFPPYPHTETLLFHLGKCNFGCIFYCCSGG